MPSFNEQRNDALAALQRKGQVYTVPVLSDEDVAAILAECQRASIWEAETEYEVGQTIIPTVRNGRRYICIQAGTSGESDEEPDFTLFQTGLTTDGDSDPQLIWQENGPDWDNVFDVNKAVHLAWLQKAQQVAYLYDKGEIGSSHRQSQIYDHCIDQAAKWQPLEIA